MSEMAEEVSPYPLVILSVEDGKNGREIVMEHIKHGV
jgi:hypothetical protein